MLTVFSMKIGAVVCVFALSRKNIVYPLPATCHLTEQQQGSTGSWHGLYIGVVMQLDNSESSVRSLQDAARGRGNIAGDAISLKMVEIAKDGLLYMEAGII